MADTATRRVRVTDHAVDQYRQRIRPDDLRNKTIRNTIAELVRCGLEAGNILNHKPKRFRLYGEKNGALPENQRFVWCDKDHRVGFIVLLEEGYFVKTTLVSVWAKA